jgi:hypothetical protein
MENEIELTPEKSEKRSRLPPALRLPLLMCIVALVAAGGILAGLKLAAKPVDTTVKGGVNLTIDKNAGEYVAADSEPSQGIAIPGWGTISIPAGQLDVNTVDFFNPEANADKYYLTFELRLLDDSEQGYEVLYTSDLVEPDKHIQHITLSRALDVGEYPAVVHVQPYRMDEDQTPTNNADMKTTLKVS